MPRKFLCPKCQKTLRVPDGFQGRQAKCPQCGVKLAIGRSKATSSPNRPTKPNPAQGQTSAQTADPDPLFDTGLPPASQVVQPFPNPFSSTAAVPPSGRPASSTVNPYKFANAPVSPTSIQGPGRGNVVPTPGKFGEIFRHAWDTWIANLGLLVGITALVFAIPLILHFGIRFFFFLMSGWVFDNLTLASRLIFALVFLAAYILIGLLSLYLIIGMSQIFLQLLRGQGATIRDLLRGGDRILSVVGLCCLQMLCQMGVGVAIGVIVLASFLVTDNRGVVIVAGIVGYLVLALFIGILNFFLWPAWWLQVDGKKNVIESLNVATSLVKVNVGTTFLLVLVNVGCTLVGAITFGIGFLFIIPLIMMLWASAYLSMSGQINTQTKCYANLR